MQIYLKCLLVIEMKMQIHNSLMVKCQTIMQKYFKSRLVKCPNMMQIYIFLRIFWLKAILL